MFHFTGQLDLFRKSSSWNYVTDVFKANRLSTVLDLSKIDFLDSSGLGALVQLAKQCKTPNAPLFLSAIPRHTNGEACPFEGFLNLADDLPSALKRLGA